MSRRIAAGLGLIGLGLVIAVATGWGALALFYLAPGSEPVRTALAWGFAALGLVAVAARAGFDRPFFLPRRLAGGELPPLQAG